MRVATLLVALLQLGVLTGPDPAQMETAPDLGYKPIPHTFVLPDGKPMGAPAAVATTSAKHTLVFSRGALPLQEYDQDGTFIRAFGDGMYTRAHGLRLDADDNIWTTDVGAHTVTKMNARSEVLLVLGTKGQAGAWDEPAGTRLLNEPNDVAIGPAGEIYVVQGHGRGEPRVLKFAKTGAFVTSWGGKGSGPGQFDTAHSIVLGGDGLVYVADRQNRRVQIFDAGGRYVREWKFAGLPCGLYVDRDSQMYLVSGFSGQILKLDANGHAIAATGQPGKGLGQFGEAHYLTIGSRGEIYVADTVNAVLHKFVKR